MVPWRFIFSIFMLFVLLFFVGLNINNRAEIRYWFGSDKEISNIEIEPTKEGIPSRKKGEVDVPVIFALFGAFLVGVLVTLPLVFKKKIQYIDMARELRRSGLAKNKKDKTNTDSLAQNP